MSRAWDEVRAPQMDLIEDCVHCGFCLPTCPTYQLWGEEMDSPRGRIHLMKQGLEPGSTLSLDMVGAFDNCLGCMACVTACPSGVQYDKLIEDTRAQVERHTPRSPADRAWRRLLFETFPHPGRLRALAPGIAVGRALKLERAPALGRFPRLAALVSLAPRTSLRRTQRRMPPRIPARGARRGTAGLMQGCVQRVFFSDVNVATARVLAAEGWDVVVPREHRCCGALQLHAGEDTGSRELAKRTIAAFEACDVVAVNAAGCGSAMKDYGHVLRDDPAWTERAAAFAAKVRDVSELLSAEEPRATRHPVALRAAYHDACHLAHAQGIREEPRALLRAIPGVELLEPDDWEICCGSAGVYNLLQPEPAGALGERKARAIIDTGADVVIAANPGCTLQIAKHSEALGHPLRVLHPIEVLDASLAGRAL